MNGCESSDRLVRKLQEQGQLLVVVFEKRNKSGCKEERNEHYTYQH